MRLLALSLLLAPASAFWRLPCRGRLGVERMDPIVTPGEISPHAHTIHGGHNFAMSTDSEDLIGSDCTSCAVKQDKSAYWTPALYFMYQNGSSVLVDQVGGMLAYYLLYGENVTAFPKGFRMIAGDPSLRNFTLPWPDPPKSLWTGRETTQFGLMQKAIGFNCMNYKKKPEPSLYRHFLPSKDYMDEHCTDGIRMELMFPSCWNGKDLDSPDHRSHVRYPSLVNNGDCPEGFEHRLVSLFFETIWDTYAFKGEQGRFVLANGDPTGSGYHGDFFDGWDEGFLQKAADTCTNPSGRIQDCPIFDIQSDDDARQCRMRVPELLQDENTFFIEEGLPGHMPVTDGPEPANMNMSSSGPGIGMSLGFSLGGSLPTMPAMSFGLGVNMDAASTSSSGSAPTSTPTSTTTPMSSPTSTPSSTSTSPPPPPPTTSHAPPISTVKPSPTTPSTSSAPTSVTAPAPPPTPTFSPVELAAIPSSTSPSTTSTPTPTPATTAAPTETPAAGAIGTGESSYTIYRTEPGAVYEVVVIDETVTVTPRSTAQPMQSKRDWRHRRHAHAHVHGHALGHAHDHAVRE